MRDGDPEAWWVGLTTDELWAEIGRRADADGITEEDVEREVEAVRGREPDTWWAELSLDDLLAEIRRRARAGGFSEAEIEEEVEASRAGR